MGILSLIVPDTIDGDFRELASTIHGSSTRGKLSITGTSAILLYTYLHKRLSERGVPEEEIDDQIWAFVDHCIEQYFSHALSEPLNKKGEQD